MELRIDVHIHPPGEPAPNGVSLILAALQRIQTTMSALTDSSQAVQDDVKRLLADQAAVIAKAVADALAASAADEATAEAVNKATTDAIDAFDPLPAPGA